ncbi:MAG: hypothetical protein JRJ64_04500 [Deltaproteobacteria bacterium]|nr:hypothetical protein [Deltaproteobacteria bacterium]
MKSLILRASGWDAGWISKPLGRERYNGVEVMVFPGKGDGEDSRARGVVLESRLARGAQEG